MNIPPEENKPSDSEIPEESDENQEPKTDLEEIAGTTESPIINVEKLKAVDIDPATLLQENTRTWLALSLVGLLASTLVLFGFYIYWNKDSKDTEGLKSSKELLTLIWTSEVTLVSGALGFYFASSKGR